MKAKLYRQRRLDPDVERAAEKLDEGAESLLPVLQDVQAKRGYLDRNAIGATSDVLGVSDSHAFGLASFYSMLSTTPCSKNVVRVCDGPVCCLRGADDVRQAIETAVASQDVCVERTSCIGLCDQAPAALVGLEQCGPLDAPTSKDILTGPRCEPKCYSDAIDGEVRIAMERIGKIDPDDIDSAIESGAYRSLQQALQKAPGDVIEEISQSGLQGRGGAGFPTGRKWQFVAAEAGSSKYVVCNADESEPTAFKDRVLMENDPHRLIEGVALAAYAVGASHGFIYIRGEYEPAARRLENAIEQAEQRGWIGENIRGSDFSLTIHVHRGAGAYICGEETALLESLEGRRGMPRIRPPFPTSKGLFDKPTVVNNVETLCKIPSILEKGAEWYRSLGTENSPGTKMFTVTGHVKNPGAFEAPFGITLRQVIERFGGGMQDDSAFKMALTGGAAGTIVGVEALDVPLDFSSRHEGVSLGAGAIFVMDESVSVLTLLGWILKFFELESCGKCTPCREGTLVARQLIQRLERGDTHPDDESQLARLSKMLRVTSFCGLGQSVGWPIDSALANFPEEFRLP